MNETNYFTHLFTQELIDDIKNSFFDIYGDNDFDCHDSEWYETFEEICDQTNNKELFEFYDSLPFYEADIFDKELLASLKGDIEL